MKTWLKTTLISGILCCVVGVVLFAAGVVTGGREYVQNADINTLRGDARKDDSSHIAVLNKQKISNVQALDIALDSLDLKIVPSDDDSCYLSYRIAATKGQKPLTYAVQNGTLHLKENDVSNLYVHIDIDFLTDLLTSGRLPEEDDTQTVILSVPKTQLKQLSIRSSYGDISMRGIAADNSSIQCANGNIELESCQLSQLKLNGDYGDIDFNHCTINTADISLSNGDFDAESTSFSGENSISNSYGDVSVSDTLANLQALTIQATTAYGEISVPDRLQAQTKQTSDDDLTAYCHDGTGGSSLCMQASNGDIEISDD